MKTDFETMLAAHLARVEAAFAKHEASMAEINARQSASTAATLATLELELDRLQSSAASRH